MRNTSCLKAFLAVFLLGAVFASATTVIPMSVEKITGASTLVAEARALDSHSAWNAEHSAIYTYTRFQLTRVLKGTAPTTITVKQMGGRAGGYTERVSGVRSWATGEEAVLFLHPSEKNDGTMVVTGLFQGNFSVQHLQTGETVVGNGVPDASAFDSANHTISNFQGKRVTLRELEATVQRVVSK